MQPFRSLTFAAAIRSKLYSIRQTPVRNDFYHYYISIYTNKSVISVYQNGNGRIGETVKNEEEDAVIAVDTDTASNIYVHMSMWGGRRGVVVGN